MRCVSYMSGRMQNEFIAVLEKHIILPEIVEEIKNVPFYIILADEVTSHNVEHLAVCAKFVNENRRYARNSLHSSLLTVSLESRLPESSLSSWRRTKFLLPTCMVKAFTWPATCHLIVLVSKDGSVK